jgi:glutamate 5-kinase
MSSSQRIVIKLGTSTLTAGGKNISAPTLVDLIRQMASLQVENVQIVMVSSGAIAAGRQELGFPDLPKHLPAKQMLAAVGQPRLMAMYEQYFAIYNICVAQVLLTRNDLTDRRGYLNARNTLEALISNHIVPIVNENDTVATEEIRFGDNDHLSAQVANLIEADQLFLLTDQDGLYSSDPRTDSKAKLIREVGSDAITPELWHAAGGTNNGLGTGGMITKLHAADLARHGGTVVKIARGTEADVLLKLFRGEKIGTTVMPTVNTLEGRKRYILSGSRISAEVEIDAGAVKALNRGGSLLPAGILKANGEFERGDTVNIVTHDGRIVAVGLINYGSVEIGKICGAQSGEIETRLGYTFGDEAVHRNNMILM